MSGLLKVIEKERIFNCSFGKFQVIINPETLKLEKYTFGHDQFNVLQFRFKGVINPTRLKLLASRVAKDYTFDLSTGIYTNSDEIVLLKDGKQLLSVYIDHDNNFLGMSEFDAPEKSSVFLKGDVALITKMLYDDFKKYNLD
jgi:hypothetical protein